MVRHAPPSLRPPTLPLRRRRSRKRAFTLLETALAMVIVTVGVVAIVDAFRGFIKANGWSSQEATATYLANEIREFTRRLPRHDPITGLVNPMTGIPSPGLETGEDPAVMSDYDDVDDFKDKSFGYGATLAGPIDALGNIIYEVDENGEIKKDGFGNPLPLVGWTQSVYIEKVDPFNLDSVQAWNATVAPSGSFVGRAMDDYPLRVTVLITYTGAFDPEPQAVVTMTWIIP